MFRHARRTSLALFVLLLAIAAVVVYAYRFHPLTTEEWRARASLRWEGWTPFAIDGITGLERNYCAEGEACACVALVHGLCDTVTTWKAMLDEGRETWGATRVMAIDLPGAGDTVFPRSKKDVSVRKLAARLNGVFRKRCSRWTVVGNSLGGWISTWMALEDPKLVDRLVLLSPAGMSRQSASAFQHFVHPTESSVKDFMKLTYFQPVPVPDFAWADIVQSFKACESLGLNWEEAKGDALEPHLREIKTPTTIFWGLADRLIDISAGREMASLIPGATLLEIPRCGHLPQRECPGAVFSALNLRAPSRDKAKTDR